MQMSKRAADWGLLALRIVIAAIFLFHGWQKIQLWMSGTTNPLMMVLAVVEPVAAILVLIGYFTRWASLALAVIMIGAIYYKMTGQMGDPIGFATPTGPGWEFDLALLGGALALAGVGPGCLALECKECWSGAPKMTGAPMA